MGLYILKFPYRKVLVPLARKLAWLHPDVVSYLAVAAALATGWCYYQGAAHPLLLAGAVVLTFSRMTLNTLDGVMALNRGNLSLTGEIVNALPDRYSDIFVIAGVALSPLCRAWLGLAGLCSMFLVSYTGMLGKALTVGWQHQGPLGKVERLILLMVFTLVQFFLLASGRSGVACLGVTTTALEWVMGLYVILGQAAVFNRCRGQVREIKRKEALERLAADRNRGTAVVIYDSMTGNTKTVAEEIARGLGCSAYPAAAAPDISPYRLVVLGTPNIRKEPSEKMKRFQQRTEKRPEKLALFTTFGMPAWGQVSSPLCLAGMEKAWGQKAVGRFACRGFHVKYRTYAGHPDEEDKLKAFLFGLKLEKKLK